MNLSELFQQHRVTDAHIVDDAYDSSPTVPYSAEDAQQLLEVATDADLSVLCSILGLVDDDEEGVRTKLQDISEVKKLFVRRNEIVGNAADILFAPFDRDVAGKKLLLKPLTDLLEASGVKCHCFGNDYDSQNTAPPQLLFVDLRLNEGGGDLPRHDDAVRIYRTLTATHKGCHPFVFLMSSLALALDSKRQAFRTDADLFQSEFEHIDKAAFTNGDELSRVLSTYTQAMPQLEKLRQAMEGVQTAVGGAMKSVMRELRALDLADYFVLHHNTTSVEKVELGPYVVEMLLEFIAHEIEGQNHVWELARELDGLDLKQLPRSRFGITPAAAQLYSSNMLHSPAMLLAEDARQHGPSHGYFFTGDVYFDAQSLNLPIPERAYAIVTPACDLVRPEKLKGRSILLCEGKVQEMVLGSQLIAPDGLSMVVMPHPRNSERFLVIEWQRKKLHVWGEADREKFRSAATCSYVRVGRLRAIYALQLQHAVTADLSRVGTQKPPNTLVPHGLKCFVSDSATWHEIYEDRNADAAALADAKINGKLHTTYVLSDSAVHRAMIRLSAWLDSNSGVKDKARIEKARLEDARKALRGFQQKVPEKAPQDKELDVTAYPLANIWHGGDERIIAVVRTNCASPYSQIAHGHAVSQHQDAKVVFRLEKPIQQDDSADADRE